MRRAVLVGLGGAVALVALAAVGVAYGLAEFARQLEGRPPVEKAGEFLRGSA